MVAKFVRAVFGDNILLGVVHIKGCLMYSPDITITIFYKGENIASGLLFYCPETQVVQEQVTRGELLDTATHSGDIGVTLTGNECLQYVSGADRGGIALMVACSEEMDCRGGQTSWDDAGKCELLLLFG